ncbi:phage portal protein [Microbacterium trichothecenolyticum]|uniref:phage portal protein n=1 Tax=Microbacterium trichothecenolyticum TaxID=69370 RepID=UPI001C6E2709|nr:phage portal protein [Microbacterium trichothecenolyticum]MBW9118878.1 phage portal protein [Microbacterium trichothecenolyticum]
MSVLFRGAQRSSAYSAPFPGPREGRWRRPAKKAALAHSAAWGCVRLRSDLISTLPIDAFRKSTWGQIEVPKPPVLIEPGGSDVDIAEWMYSSQSDLDSVGNTFGLITETDGNGKPRRIDLIAREDVTVQSFDGVVTYRVNGKKVDREKLWHERQYTSSGVSVGLSPLAYASLSLMQHQAAQDFAAAWFGGGLIPTGFLKYAEAKVPPAEAEAIKLRFKLAIEGGDPFVAGKDWEYKPIEAAAAQSTFLETMAFTDIEICRFFGVPADLIDANAPGSSITYANITQRNLQFLVLNLGAPIKRREVGLSRLLPAPRFVKLNTAALLRMDPETVARMLGQQVRDRLVAPSEARELDNRAPFTEDQLEEFDRLFGRPKSDPATAKGVTP